MRNKIGVMQGRLLPKYQGRYQAFPVGNWRDEFKVAKEYRIDLIEFILDFNDFKENPLLEISGINEIANISKDTGVMVKTICADYFMESPLHSKDVNEANSSKDMLVNLLYNAIKLGVSDIVIPCVDQSTLASQEAIELFISAMMPIVKIAEDNNINFSLETDLEPKEFLSLLEYFDSNNLTVNYDIGNSAALGYNSEEELTAYGHKISDIHIKDRVLGGGPIILGEGNADFDVFFKKLKEFDYQGPFIMQAYRDNEGVEIFKKQLNWVKQYIHE